MKEAIIPLEVKGYLLVLIFSPDQMISNNEYVKIIIYNELMLNIIKEFKIFLRENSGACSMLKIVTLFILSITSLSIFADCPDYLNVDKEILRSKKTLNICENFGNKPILIVNTASHCSFTPQFEGIEALYNQYKDQGLVVLGFPSDTFKQEADSKEEMAEVCYINYGVTFQMFSDISVRGDDADPIFKELARQSKPPTWNFNKYLLDKNGNVVEHFGSTTKPDSSKIHDAIKKVL